MLAIVSTTSHPIATASALAEAVRRRRAEFHWTQNDLAIGAGVGRGVVQKLETGRGTVTLDSLLPILTALGLDLHLTPRDGR